MPDERSTLIIQAEDRTGRAIASAAQNLRKLDQAMKGKRKATAVTRKSYALDSERLTLSITSCSVPPATFRSEGELTQPKPGLHFVRC